MSHQETLITNARIMTSNSENMLISNGFMYVKDGIIQSLGPMESHDWQGLNNCLHIDAEQTLLTPGLIDCHTHLIFAGERCDEFALRQSGVSYAEIAKRGGGILSTVAATRQASFDELYLLAKQRLNCMIRQGVLAFEIKSGYGLDLDTEIKMLNVARQLQKDLDIPITTSFLGAHACPLEFSSKDDYIDYVCDTVLPKVAECNLADAVDVFSESIGFNLKQTEKIFKSAKALHLPIKCHAEQLSNLGASRLAAEYQAMSCDHIEYIDETAIMAMAHANTTAVVLPGAFYYLKEKRKPPIELLRAHGVPIAIATDCNPGSSPTFSLPLMMNMACILFDMSVEEVLLGTTAYAAKALQMENELGMLKPGMAANFILWEVRHESELVYYLGKEFSKRCFIRGYERPEYNTPRDPG